MDLFDYSKLKENELHPNFRNIIQESRANERETLNKWIEGFKDRDNKFVHEFQTTFNSSFWEIYCFAILKELNYICDFSYSRPDFVLKRDNRIEFFCECTVSNAPQNGIEEYDIEEKLNPKMSIEESLDLSTIRALNRLKSKKKWYSKNKNKILNFDDKPFVIAYAPFDQPHFQTSNLGAIMRVLYSYDGCYYERGVYSNSYKKYISKSEKVDLDLGIFLDNSYEDISGILFSCVGTWSKVSACTPKSNLYLSKIDIKGTI